MANMYSEMTGEIFCVNRTSIIEALFSPFNVDKKAAPDSGRFYIAQGVNDGEGWDSVIDELIILADGLKIKLPDDLDDKDDSERTQIVLSLFGDHFGASGNTDLENFIEHCDFDDNIELDHAYFLARIFDDGHGFKGGENQTAWYCDRLQLGEFGGAGEYSGKHFECYGDTGQVLALGAVIEAALEDGNLLVAANHFSATVNSLLNGINDAEVRELVRLMLIENLKTGEIVLSYDERVTVYENQGMTRSDAQGVVDAEDRSKKLKQFEVVLQMEIGREYEWTGLAEDIKHAEGLAIAEATSKTGEQVFEVKRSDQVSQHTKVGK